MKRLTTVITLFTHFARSGSELPLLYGLSLPPPSKSSGQTYGHQPTLFVPDSSHRRQGQNPGLSVLFVAREIVSARDRNKKNGACAELTGTGPELMQIYL
ncbi:MAG: hypothetical protein H8E73_02825 [Planctomycetes bacterium]|nr:hypothetical protein [Planctomycetota bacterium]MBL7184697.1 hypothetical protein [Phycisphaerae bacterium]